MDFKSRRVEAHNVWPASTEFRAEAEFKARIAACQTIPPFAPIPVMDNSDPDYQRSIGHLIDGLDALPNRPDFCFDHCFKVLDLAKSSLAAGKGIRGVMEKLPTKLLKLDTKSWAGITGELGKAIPRVTVDLLAKRLLQAQMGQGQNPTLLVERAERCMGKDFYAAFCAKYTTDEAGSSLVNFNRNIPRAGSLLRLYLSGEPGTRAKRPTVSVLDLTTNPISAETRMKVLLSLLLFTVRNERAHGAVMSPFRTSKANFERYSSYYYLMLVAYVFALGSLALLHTGKSVSSKTILAGCSDNLAKQKSFFGSL
jgi:hypothetical protein